MMSLFGRGSVASALLLLASTLTAEERPPGGNIANCATQESVHRESLSEGNVQEAIRALDEGFQAARRQGEAPHELARALNDLGTFYQDLYRLPDALRCYLPSRGRKKQAHELMEWAQAIVAEDSLRNRIGFTVDLQVLPSRR